jgi:hypothetical protein
MQSPSFPHTHMQRIGLVLCLALPWLNPFTNSPSTSVMPLLVSWMLAACAVLAVVDAPVIAHRSSTAMHVWGVVLGLWALVSVLTVPEVVDHGLTMGLIASLACVALMWAVGRRVAVVPNALLGWVVGAVLVAAVVSAVLGVLQYLDLVQSLSPWVNQPAKGDAFANLRQRNQFASLTSIGLVAALGWQAMWASQRSKVEQVSVWLVLNVLAAGVACSVSRTGAVQWVLIGVLCAVWAWRRGQTALLWAALAAPVLVVLWSVLMPWAATVTTGKLGASMILRVAGQAQDYGMCGSRTVLWSNVLTMVAQKPWLGWGWGETDYAHFITAYSGMRFCDILDNAHDFPLHLALEFGVPFAVAVLGWMFAWVWLQQPWREVSAQRVMAWGWLLGVGIHSVLEYPLWYGPFQMTVGLALGMVWAKSDARTQMPSTERTQAVWMALACVMFVGCLYTAWDFKRVGQIYKAPAARDAAYAADPLGYAKQSWLFQNQAEFAELSLQATTPDNAAQVYNLAQRMMHYSPESRVVQRVIEAAEMLNVDAEQTALLKARLEASKVVKME